MEPLSKKTLLPGTVEGQFKQLQWQQCHCKGTAMGTSRAGAGWTCWLSSAHSWQWDPLRALDRTLLWIRRKTSVVNPEPKLLFLHTGNILSSFGGRIMPSTWAQVKEHSSASSAMDPGQHAGPYRKGRSESEHRYQPINTFTMAKPTPPPSQAWWDTLTSCISSVCPGSLKHNKYTLSRRKPRFSHFWLKCTIQRMSFTPLSKVGG